VQVLFERSLTRELVPVRLIGLGATRLAREGDVQPGLFDTDVRERQGALDRAVDAIRSQFGSSAIQRGSFLDRPGEEGK